MRRLSFPRLKAEDGLSFIVSSLETADLCYPVYVFCSAAIKRLSVGIPIIDPEPCHSRIYGCLGHRRGNPGNKPRIDGFRNDIILSELKLLKIIGFQNRLRNLFFARAARAFVAASFISSLMVVALTSSAPLKIKGIPAHCLSDWDSLSDLLKK
ncbi:MAG: hypothetical protein MZV63_05160 [Marinilabiliales bacterium]|nr:hypothetical protein [Marinilabiliales bacterium]